MKTADYATASELHFDGLEPGTVIVLIGLPGSGKSCLAGRLKREIPNSVVVSSDRIRKLLYGREEIQGDPRDVFSIADGKIINGVRDGRIVIYDATNLHLQTRKRLISMLREIGASHIIGIWVNTPLEVCLERNRARRRKVPLFAIERMVAQALSEKPRLEDGFDEFIELTG